MNHVAVNEPIRELALQARIAIAFEVRSIFDVEGGGTAAAWRLTERRVATSYVKDYDAIPGNSPRDWANRFDVANWGLIGVLAGSQRVGGAVVAWGTQELTKGEHRPELAVLWDIRVAPQVRGRGIGTALFRAAEAWAAARGCTEWRIETQNVNVPACRFYAAQGCTLNEIERHAYPEFPEEVRLGWTRQIRRATPA